MALIGYARVSTEHQELELQIKELTAHGCIKVFSEKESGGNRSRPELIKCFDYLREGDTLVIHHLDRLARDTWFTLDIQATLVARGIDLKGLAHPIDIGTPEGRLMMTHMASYAQYMRESNSRNVIRGIANYRSKGNSWGRPRKINTEEQEIEAVSLHSAGLPIAYIQKRMGISSSTLYRVLAAAAAKGRYPEYKPREMYTALQS